MIQPKIRGLGMLASLLLAAAAQAQTPLDSYLTSLKTLRAEFSQVVTDNKGQQTQKAEGKLVIVRPGRFRWELTPLSTTGGAASPQLMVADGKNLWFYDRDLEQVSVKPASTALTATPAGLLSGEGNIRELFAVSPAGKKDGLDWVLVTPKENDADFREARLGFGLSELKRMVLKDKLGQTVRLDFFSSERNPPVAEAEVKFTPPAGADVIGTPTP
ncbi:MAG TPA: outer membrane lipoprotein chaperone LolA [Steroidobacteraceae bacterium]|jgi:outer membrane lipoprotein carrier protein|nr:outer membrane lipoprotein chaperone LolA [Steroidobacteraceae bacterium]